MDFIIQDNFFDKDKIISNGNRLLTANGYLGYRGTLDEFTCKQCVGLNVANLYDGLKGKWRETVNAFNPFYLQLEYNGEGLDVFSDNLTSHSQKLDISCGVFSRTSHFNCDGTNVELYSERFCSMTEKEILCSKTIITSDKDIVLTLKAGVDDKIWDINGPHIINISSTCADGVITVSGTTQENNIPISVSCVYSCKTGEGNSNLFNLQIKLSAGKPYVLFRNACVNCGEKEINLPKQSYEYYYKKNSSIWQKLWYNSDVVIEGDDYAQKALRYSIYHLLILAPKGDYSIAARGLSGQTYKGAVFWDTEMFMLPFFLASDLTTARRLVKYRIDCLEESKKKALYYGYKGAFYAWESQNGYDACSDFNVVDVFTHRPVRTYFKDKQVHISSAVAYGLINYYKHSGDVSIMFEGGLRTLIECSLFYYSYSYFNHIKLRYELLDVIGPDEYHERVNNNAYTNYMAHYTVTQTLKLLEELSVNYSEKVSKILKDYPADIRQKLDDWAQKLYLPKQNNAGVIEQFDGYYKNEDVNVNTVRQRLVKPNEYWGGSTGVATATRVIKQADSVMLVNLLPEYFSDNAQAANYNYYLPYTEHGSSLSACMYALAACKAGKADDAWEWFIKTAEIDLVGGGKQWAGEIYIGGTHPAANGGAWMTAVYGFAGMKVVDGCVSFKPNLPKNIKSMSFKILEKGVHYNVKIDACGAQKVKINEV